MRWLGTRVRFQEYRNRGKRVGERKESKVSKTVMRRRTCWVGTKVRGA